LSQKWKELVGKARSKQLQPNEYNSGLFIVVVGYLVSVLLERFNRILIVPVCLQELSRFPIWVCLELTDLMPYFHQARLVLISNILSC
jgi:hypothetical protein